LPLRLASNDPASDALILHRVPATAWHQPVARGDARQGAEAEVQVLPIGYFHIDIAEARPKASSHLYVAIDRTSKFAFVQLVTKTGRTSASAFLVALIAAVPYTIHTVLTDNGIQFTFPPRYADGPTATYMTHMFDMRCRENGIEHRLTKIRHPWTNGQVERMNRTIKEATVKRYHYDSHAQLTRISTTSSTPTIMADASRPARPHSLRIHLQNLANRAGKFNQSAPSNAGTKHPVDC
jgi:hypothetical protein